MKADLYPYLQRFINQQNEAYEILNSDKECKDRKKYEDICINHELYLAKAIMDEFPHEKESSKNSANKIAKIILAANGQDNHITISTEIR